MTLGAMQPPFLRMLALSCTPMLLTHILPAKHYHTAWTTHGGPWRTSNSSVEGLLDAFAEFQNRSIHDSKVAFVFLSNMWDVFG